MSKDPRIERLKQQQNAGQLDLVSYAGDVTSAQRDRLVEYLERVAVIDPERCTMPRAELMGVVSVARRILAELKEG
jgi:DNA-directed RNA polymerase subunit F